MFSVTVFQRYGRRRISKRMSVSPCREQGQYDTVIREELPQIFEAFKKLSTVERKEQYRPKLSIIICG